MVAAYHACGTSTAHPDPSLVSLSIPDHRELAPGTLRKLIRLSSISIEEFCSALD